MIKNKLKSFLKDNNITNSYHISAAMCNRETFGPLRGCNIGKTVVLCGAGPTLKEYIPIENAIHFAMNRALLYDKVHFDYFIADDWEGVDFFKDELEHYDCQKFLAYYFGDELIRNIPDVFAIKAGAKRYFTDSYFIRNGFESEFVANIDVHAVGNMPNIALEAMQIVLFTNPTKLYIVGCDASAGHFVQPKELTQERILAQEKSLKQVISNDKTIEKWKRLAEFAQYYYPETEIISVNPVGLKGIFKDWYQD